jgi:hypothetical protein
MKGDNNMNMGGEMGTDGAMEYQEESDMMDGGQAEIINIRNS